MQRVIIRVSKYKGVGRGVVLVLLLLAIIGPWFYTLDGVPPPEWCKAPLFLLENGRCAGLVSGTFVVAFASGAFINLNWGLVTGATIFPDRAREFFGVYLFMLYVILIMLPLCTTAVFAWMKGSWRWRRFHLAACGSATILSCLPALLEPELRSGRFWGMWLYIGVIICTLILEAQNQMPTRPMHNLNAISQTLLIPLYFRALESQRPAAMVRDPKAVELVNQLKVDLSGVQKLKNEQVNYLLRMREFDRLALAFLAEHPTGVIVDLGCGLDTRFERIDNGQVEWYGLDLPEVIELRNKLLDETPRSHFIGCSVLDFTWMDTPGVQTGKPILFLAEAVLVYLEEADVRRLVQALAQRFPGAELVCDVYSPVVVRLHPRPQAVARPRWGLKNDREVEAWAPGVCLLNQWYYFDQPEPRLGAFQLMRYLPSLARMVRIVHYRLGNSGG